ncbi:hypothetical protein Gbem_1856 [Citrifermentans bemidjiense Bem]|uniref:DUF2062 domain-containing protein n=1 Tax=Citrifermentans bemidjiense (strain ATCC BAA-1014 / DSM 16622 / JCM 12645 / Bem) TaxID=404380 RepID=B5EB09_CITBB|nr:DUF2062 domain-containing protein [Citrifermentans bemidjiense]ACH38870.1 hypothetical protein Gbem_1856 [Citrifermentans bemidjiense Bem]
MAARFGWGALRGAAAAVVGSGMSPGKLSLTICLGSAVGVMPLLWGTTVICVALAARLRLNQAAMLAVNYLCYPLQLALLLPFCRLGEAIFPWGAAVNAELLLDALHGGIVSSFRLVAWATAKGIGAWALTALPLALVLHPLLSGRFKGRLSEGAASSSR